CRHRDPALRLRRSAVAVVRVWGWGILSPLLVLVAAGALVSEEPSRPTEYEVKAAFLYNFAKFVKWPDDASPGPTFVIAVLGDDPFGDVLDRTLAGKAVLDRKVEVRRLHPADPVAGVQILFVSSSERPRVGEILKSLHGAAVLTVGEMDGFTDR